MSIHSPNTLPEGDNVHFSTLFTKYAYHYKINQVEIELLGEGYVTDCYEYDLDYKYANFNMESDCITNCVIEKFRKNCNSNDIAVYYNLLRNGLLKFNMESKIILDNPCRNNFVVEAQCLKICRPNCKFKYYLWEEPDYGERYLDNREKIIVLTHSPIPDIVIKHSPQITFISFV